MGCFPETLAHPALLLVIAFSGLAGMLIVGTAILQRFHGRWYYALTLAGVIWVLMSVGLETVSTSSDCQFLWAKIAWLGNALIPVSWCFFVQSFTHTAHWMDRVPSRGLVIILPVLSTLMALTNDWHHLIYLESSGIPDGRTRVDFVHGPGFYALVGILYLFVLASLGCIFKAFLRAKPEAWPLLSVLLVVSTVPLGANILYVGAGITVMGLDPTAPMFVVGILAFTWVLVSSRSLNMAAAGKATLFNSMSEPVVILDSSFKPVLLNNAARELGLPGVLPQLKEDLRDRILAETNLDRTDLTISERVFEPRVQQIESPFAPEADFLGWSVTLVDVTERNQTNVALQDALAATDRAIRAKDEFVSYISHEMRTPLTSLKGGLALALSGKLGELSAETRRSLEVAHRNGLRLSRLIDNLLLARKLEVGEISLTRDEVNLAQLMKESIEENAKYAFERQIEIRGEGLEYEAIVAADEFAVRQIIDNIISNAIKFSEKGSEILAQVVTSGSWIKASIRDSGPGIPSGNEDLVFGQFKQVAKPGLGSMQSSGLGLHISKQLADRMEGRLYYESQEGRGTTFYLEFEAVPK